jgi:hypothetical protein
MRRQDRGHGLGMDRLHHVVRRRRQEAIERVLAIDRILLRPAAPAPCAPNAREGKEGSILPNERTISRPLLPITGSAASVGSRKEVPDTRWPKCCISQARQCGELVFRM